MALATETEMSATEIDDFLGRNETGVLSLAREGDPYAIPISYGYDTTERTIFMRLVSTPESDKRAFLGSTPTARLVVYDESPDGSTYWSVVAAGTLEGVDPDALSVAEIEQYGETRRPLFEIWGADTDDLEIELYRLDPADLSGRRTDVERSTD